MFVEVKPHIYSVFMLLNPRSSLIFVDTIFFFDCTPIICFCLQTFHSYYNLVKLCHRTVLDRKLLCEGINLLIGFNGNGFLINVILSIEYVTIATHSNVSILLEIELPYCCFVAHGPPLIDNRLGNAEHLCDFFDTV